METKTYILDLENGKRRKVTVPANWKVTFGPAAVGIDKAAAGMGRKVPMALRFYENKENQRAIFTDVVSFRDSSINIEEEVVNTKIKEGFVEVDGVRKATSFSATTKEWMNPDIIVDEPKKLAMPTDYEMSLEEEENN